MAEDVAAAAHRGDSKQMADLLRNAGLNESEQNMLLNALDPRRQSLHEAAMEVRAAANRNGQLGAQSGESAASGGELYDTIYDTLKDLTGGNRPVTMADKVEAARQLGIPLEAVLSPDAGARGATLAAYDAQLMADRAVAQKYGVDVYALRTQAAQAGVSLQEMAQRIAAGGGLGPPQTMSAAVAGLTMLTPSQREGFRRMLDSPFFQFAKGAMDFANLGLKSVGINKRFVIGVEAEAHGAIALIGGKAAVNYVYYGPHGHETDSVVEALNLGLSGSPVGIIGQVLGHMYGSDKSQLDPPGQTGLMASASVNFLIGFGSGGQESWTGTTHEVDGNAPGGGLALGWTPPNAGNRFFMPDEKGYALVEGGIGPGWGISLGGAYTAPLFERKLGALLPELKGPDTWRHLPEAWVEEYVWFYGSQRRWQQ